MLWKWCTQYASKSGKLSSGHRTEKSHFSFQSQRKAMPKNCSKCCTIALISHASKVMLKILQARLQQHVNRGLPVVQADFRKGRGTRDQITNICWIIEKAREFQKNLLLFHCLCWSLWLSGSQQTGKFLEMEIPDHLTCLLRNLYAGQEATVRTLYRTNFWLKIEKGVRQGCLLSCCLFNLYAEHIMRNSRLDELQTGIKIGKENSKNLRYMDDTTLIAESKEDIKNLLMRVKKESEKNWLKTQHSKN